MGRSVLGLHWALLSLGVFLLPGPVAAQLSNPRGFDLAIVTGDGAGPLPDGKLTLGIYRHSDPRQLSSIRFDMPADSATGYSIFTGAFGDFRDGIGSTDPGFQAMPGMFANKPRGSAGEEVWFRALDDLTYWDPAGNRWIDAAPNGEAIQVFGAIPSTVMAGYLANRSSAYWNQQLNLYRNGTRFTTDGIVGPDSAPIDDADGAGAFHAHLDWTLTSKPGTTPAAGAYMLQLQLYSPTMVRGQPKYEASDPFFLMFNYNLPGDELAIAMAARTTAPAMPVPEPASSVLVVAGIAVTIAALRRGGREAKQA